MTFFALIVEIRDTFSWYDVVLLH